MSLYNPALQPSKNLLDLLDPAAARVNLGAASTAGDVFTGPVRLSATTFQINRTSDITTNFERVTAYWNGTTFDFAMTYAGTAAARPMRFVIDGNLRMMINTSITNGAIDIGGFSSGTVSAIGLRLSPTFTGSSGMQYVQSAAPTITQASTAGLAVYDANPTLTSKGSGSYFLYSGRVGGAQRWSVSDLGDMEFYNATAGIILKAPGGARWRVTIDDAGTLVRTAL